MSKLSNLCFRMILTTWEIFLKEITLQCARISPNFVAKLLLENGKFEAKWLLVLVFLLCLVMDSIAETLSSFDACFLQSQETWRLMVPWQSLTAYLQKGNLKGLLGQFLLVSQARDYRMLLWIGQILVTFGVGVLEAKWKLQDFFVKDSCMLQKGSKRSLLGNYFFRASQLLCVIFNQYSLKLTLMHFLHHSLGRFQQKHCLQKKVSLI